jgi:DNA-binding response OmpR family regulator
MRVLIVEDEAPDMASHRRIVEDVLPSVDVVEATTFAEATHAARSDSFDLGIVDLNLHGDRHAGREIIRLLKEHGDVAIVVISGLDVGTFRPMMYAAGIWDYFEKPMDASSLRLVVQRILESRKGERSTIENRVPDLDWSDALDDPKWKGQTIRKLSVAERRILSLLIRRPDEVVKYATLFDASENWGRSPERLKRSLASMISELRKEFKQFDPDFDCIVPVGNVGYLWRVDPRA